MRSANEWAPAMEWQLFMSELIVQGADLHHISVEPCTPFLKLFSRYLGLRHNPLDRDLFLSKLSFLLAIWLECLQKCGVDLYEYGRKETDLHQQGLVSWDRFSSWSLQNRYYLTNITYGPSPSDWKLELEYRPEDATESVAKVPGGWVEDDSSERSEDLSEEEEVHKHEKHSQVQRLCIDVARYLIKE